MKRYIKVIRVLTVLLFLVAVFGICLLTLCSAGSAYLKGEEESYSIFENRNLEPVPEFTSTALFDGSYFKGWDNWFSDHVAGRNTMLRAYTALNMNVLQKPVVNDVYIGDGVLLPYQQREAVDREAIFAAAGQMADNLQKLQEKIESYGGIFVYVGIPEQSSMLRDSYPGYLVNNEEKLALSEQAFFSALEERGVSYVNMNEYFRETEDPAFYYSKVDHHFNMNGAEYTYQVVLNLLAQRVEGMDLAQPVTLTELPNPYYGSRNRKLYDVYPNTEHAIIADEPVAYTRYDNGEQTASALYESAPDESTPVTYGLYMHGDIAETVVDTGREELPEILIFGDSFTNPLEALFYRNFDKMRSLDLRHYREMSLSEYVEKYQPDVVLCVRDDTQYLKAEYNGVFE